jgi:hypothetical protein
LNLWTPHSETERDPSTIQPNRSLLFSPNPASVFLARPFPASDPPDLQQANRSIHRQPAVLRSSPTCCLSVSHRLALASCFELLDYLALLNSNQNPNCALGRQTSKEMQLAPNRLPKTSMASPDHQSRSARMASLVIYLRTTNIHDSWRTLKNQLKNFEKQEKTIKNLEGLTKKPRNYKQQGH